MRLQGQRHRGEHLPAHRPPPGSGPPGGHPTAGCMASPCPIGVTPEGPPGRRPRCSSSQDSGPASCRRASLRGLASHWGALGAPGEQQGCTHQVFNIRTARPPSLSTTRCGGPRGPVGGGHPGADGVQEEERHPWGRSGPRGGVAPPGATGPSRRRGTPGGQQGSRGQAPLGGLLPSLSMHVALPVRVTPRRFSGSGRQVARAGQMWGRTGTPLQLVPCLVLRRFLCPGT